MGELHLSSSKTIRVMQTWEQCKEMAGFQEAVGMQTLQLLFRMDPLAMKAFGFKRCHNIEGMERLGLLSHGLHFMRWMDALLMTALGPNSDDIFPAVVQDVSQEPVLSQCFPTLCRAFLQVFTLEHLVHEPDVEELKSSWFTVMRFLSTEMQHAIQQQPPPPYDTTSSKALGDDHDDHNYVKTKA